ncbi:MAG: FAD-binding oxidoreductase, partial [Acidimicrobiia bacterium]
MGRSGNSTGAPTPPIAFDIDPADATNHLDTRVVQVDDPLLTRLRSVCASVDVEAADRAEASRDWWPLAMIWALDGEVAMRAAAVARPTSSDQVAAVLQICNDARVPVTAAAGRSGVCGASVPLHGGVVLDCCGLAGIVDVDRDSMVLDVRAGTFGDVLEDELRREHGVTVGHWPQSVELSTVGGWLACRGA